MIFYGKASRRVAVGAALDDVEAWVAEALTARLPIERHAAWTSALVTAGGLAQGLADAATCSGEAAAMALSGALAAVMGQSWDGGFIGLPAGCPSPVVHALANLRATPALPDTVEIRRTEGFAHYALYPEAYWQAARFCSEPRPTRVLGIRSIGTTLSATVAMALGAPLPTTLRPDGHPFARTVTPSPPVAAAIRAGTNDVWAVVDEGPGLSGSSFGATAEVLGQAGIPPERVVLFPSHAGLPGAMVSMAHRRLWSKARSATFSFEDLLLDGAEQGRGLADWVADITGTLLAQPADISGGAWRQHHYGEDSSWPAVDRQNERRKYLLHGRNGLLLLRFAGLGSFGREKYARARALAAAGFGPAPLGWRHGFLIEPWRGDLRPLAGAEAHRPALLRRTAEYLAFRAKAFPADPQDGASLATLLAMARANVAETVGAAAASRLDVWHAVLPGLAARARPMAVDGRLVPHEWLGDGDGRLLKTDALDHCAGHDLVGCQDVAWDVAGAATEYALSAEETEALRAAVAQRLGEPCDPGLVDFFRIAYPAFRLGALTLARARETGAEAARLAAAITTMTAALHRALD